MSRGLIKGLDQPIVDYFPELARDPEKRKREITIEDLLTMRSGLESTSGRDYGAWVQSPNWVRYVLTRPLIDEPGTRVEYSTGTSHLLSAILTKATKTSTWQFAQESLAKPLGFSLARWTQDPQGIYFGGNEMSMTPRQMVRFGELYLNDGRAGGDAGAAEGLDCEDPRAARAIAVGQRSRVRLRLLDSRPRRPRQLLRLGLRRPVRLHRPRPAAGRGDDLAVGRQHASGAITWARSTTWSSSRSFPRCHHTRRPDRAPGSVEPILKSRGALRGA